MTGGKRKVSGRILFVESCIRNCPKRRGGSIIGVYPLKATLLALNKQKDTIWEPLFRCFANEYYPAR